MNAPTEHLASPPAPSSVLPPTPEQIDEMIADYEALVTAHKMAGLEVEKAKNHLVFLVDSFGQRPAHAEQSTRLTGRRNVATVTRGTTVTVNESAVADLENFLDSKSLLELFPRFFAQQTKHTLVDGAREVLKAVTLPRRIEEKIASLFGRAIDVKSKSPSLKVETIQPEKPVRKPRNGKAAA